MNVTDVKIGMHVISTTTTKYRGIVRHVGILGSSGHDNSVWSEWGKENWNGKILPGSMDGSLTYSDAEKLEPDNEVDYVIEEIIAGIRREHGH